MNKRHYEHTLPNIRGSLSNTYSLTSMRSAGSVAVFQYRVFDLFILVLSL